MILILLDLFGLLLQLLLLLRVIQFAIRFVLPSLWIFYRRHYGTTSTSCVLLLSKDLPGPAHIFCFFCHVMANEIHKQFINMNYHKNVKMIRQKCHHSAAACLARRATLSCLPQDVVAQGFSDLYKVLVAGANVSLRFLVFLIFFFFHFSWDSLKESKVFLLLKWTFECNFR